MVRSIALNRVVEASSTMITGLKKAVTPLWRILTFSPADETIAPASCLCVGIEQGGVAVTHASRFLSRYHLKGYRKYDFSGGNYPKPGEVASSAAHAVREMRAGRADIVLSLPKQWVVVKAAELPVSATENLSAVVSYELDRFTPFSADEALYDYRVVGENGEKISLLIAAAKAAQLNGYLSALKEAGVRVARVSFDLSGVSSLYRSLSGEDTFVFMEVGNEGFRGGAVVEGILAKTVSSDFERPEDNSRAAAVEEEMDSLASVPGKGAPPKRLLSFRGSTAALKERLKQRGRGAVRIVDEMEKRIGGFGEFREIPSASAGAAMDMLMPDSRGFDLLRKGIARREHAPFALTALLLLVMTALIGVYLLMPIKIENRRLHEIEKQIALRKKEVMAVEDLKRQIDALQREIALVGTFRNEQPLSLNILKELTIIMPPTSWLTRVRIAGPQVNLEGYAPSATVLIPKLEASRSFRKVEFSSPTFRDARQNMDRFQIKMELEGVKNEKQ
ncbi:MAG: pilus assembly protein PilM [Nitrospirales bacterium]|nr:pilus assembly protein PilM [Nitrospirales bacterium]